MVKKKNDSSLKKTKAALKKALKEKVQREQEAQVAAKPIAESEKIPFSEVGSENSLTAPPPVVKPVPSKVKVRNRTPLPMPKATASSPEDENE